MYTRMHIRAHSLTQLTHSRCHVLGWQLFLVSPKGNPDRVTVPQPFRLHSSSPQRDRRYADAQARLKQELEAKQMQDCTFRPQTNTGKVARLVKQILMDLSETVD